MSGYRDNLPSMTWAQVMSAWGLCAWSPNVSLNCLITNHFCLGLWMRVETVTEAHGIHNWVIHLYYFFWEERALTKEEQIGKQTSEGRETKGVKAIFLESHFSVYSCIGECDCYWIGNQWIWKMILFAWSPKN